MGTKNLALTAMTSDFRVQQLKLVDLELPEKFDPQSFTKQIRLFVCREIEPLLSSGENTRCLIERQRCRTMGSRAIPESILRVNFVEILLHGHLRDFAMSISPERVATHYALPKGREKKAAAVQFVKQLIKDELITIEPEHLHYYEQSRKQDDLSDSLLQARAYFQWRQEARNFRECIDQKESVNKSTCI